MAAKKTTPKKATTPKAEPAVKKLDLFAIIGDVSYEKRDLIRDSEDPEVAIKSYTPFMANKAFSYHLSSIYDANIMNMMGHVDPLLQHDYYLHALHREKRFSKWFKQDKTDALNTVAEHYQVNLKRAQEIMSVIGDEAVKRIVEMHENKGGPRNERTTR